jgi:hypothetical protein
MEVSPEEDRKHGADMILFEGRECRVACRVRTPDYREPFWWDITVTIDRETGGETEFPKFHRGWADVMFYGHTTAEDPREGEIDPWYLVRVPEWCEYNWRHSEIPKKRNNDDPGKGCWFKPYDIRLMAQEIPDIIVASSEDLTQYLAQLSFWEKLKGGPE